MQTLAAAATEPPRASKVAALLIAINYERDTILEPWKVEFETQVTLQVARFLKRVGHKKLKER